MAPWSTSALTRSGCVAANNAHMGPPSDTPNIAARSDPAASITARTSSTRCSSVGTSLTGSDSPVPRLSKTISRENELIRSKKRANGGDSHCSCNRK